VNVHPVFFIEVCVSNMWIPDILVCHPDYDCNSDWELLVMSNVWYTHFTYVHLLVVVC